MSFQTQFHLSESRQCRLFIWNRAFMLTGVLLGTERNCTAQRSVFSPRNPQTHFQSPPNWFSQNVGYPYLEEVSPQTCPVLPFFFKPHLNLHWLRGEEWRPFVGQCGLHWGVLLMSLERYIEKGRESTSSPPPLSGCYLCVFMHIPSGA